MRIQRHDATGRSTGRRKPERHTKIDGQFVPLLAEMIASPAFRVLSLAARRVLDRLELEHLRHGGAENGRLPVTYDHFEEHGIHRHSVGPAIRELSALGFVVVVEQGGGGNAAFRRASVYRLTYLPTRDAESSHDWRRVRSVEDARAIAEVARADKAAAGRRRAAA